MEKAVNQSQLSLDDLYYLPYTNYFIKPLLKTLSESSIKELKEYTSKNLVRLCNHQKSSRIIEIVFECLGGDFCDHMFEQLFGNYLADAESADRNSDNPTHTIISDDIIRREIKYFRSVVCNQYGNFTLKSLFKNTTHEFKNRYSKYIYKLKKVDNELFSHFYGKLAVILASHFFNYFKKLSKDSV